MYNHYIVVDNGIVINGYSDAFQSYNSNHILVRENAPRHFSETIPSLMNDKSQFLYKYDGELKLRTPQELQEELDNRPVKHLEIDLIKMKTLCLLLN